MHFFQNSLLYLFPRKFVSFAGSSMKVKNAILFFFVCAVSLSSVAGNLNAFFSYSTFNSPESGPYVETYLSVIGTSVQYKLNENNKFQGNIEITLVFKNGEEIVNFKKYNLLSPELDDTTSSFVNFVDQQRFSLANNDYELEIEIADVNSPDEPFKSYQPISISYPDNEISISDIELVESFTKSETESIITKSGYDVVPYVSNFYPQNLNKVGFYAEVYNSNTLGEGEQYLVNYYIESYQGSNVLARYKRFAKHSAAKVNVVMGEFNIAELPSGAYQIVVEVRDRNNELKAINKAFFQRSNPAMAISAADIAAIVDLGFVAKITDPDTIDMYVRSVYPISSYLERNFVRSQLGKDASVEMKQKFFINFWQSRNRMNPEQAWNEYKIELNKVQNAYKSSISYGFETDRGRVYLQYGPPNTIVERKQEPNAYPYEIWHYYKTDRRTNIKFVFYNREDASNEYELIHSDAYGEVNNYRWKLLIQKRSDQGFDPDRSEPEDSYGTRTDDYFSIPR